MRNNKIEKLLKEVNTLLDESNVLYTMSEKHLENGNELEWEETKMESVDKSAYARGIRYALEELNLISNL